MSDSSPSHSASGDPEAFNPEVLNSYEVQEIMGLSLAPDRNAICYIVMFVGKKSKEQRRKMLCTRRDMRLVDERFMKRYRFDYLLTYLKNHREDD